MTGALKYTLNAFILLTDYSPELPAYAALLVVAVPMGFILAILGYRPTLPGISGGKAQHPVSLSPLIRMARKSIFQLHGGAER